MRGKLRQFLVLTMAFVLLTGSVGLAATERFCAMMGVAIPGSANDVMEASGCCADEPEADCAENQTPSAKKDPCCEVATTYQKLEVEAAWKVQKVEFEALAGTIRHSFPLPTNAPLVSTASPSRYYANTSPPLAGRHLLLRLSILNI